MGKCEYDLCRVEDIFQFKILSSDFIFYIAIKRSQQLRL